MKQQEKKNLRFMTRGYFGKIFALFFIGMSIAAAQVNDSIPDTQIEPPEEPMEASRTIIKDTTNNFKRVKIDGIAAVVGAYVILN